MIVKIEKLDNYGRGICYLNNKICFVQGALTNEKVEIEITKETAKIIEAKAIKIIEESPLRIEEQCPYSAICGGCDLNHLCYNEENRFKKEKVKEIINKYAQIPTKIIEPIKYHDRNHYRNKITIHGNKDTFGLYQKNDLQ